MQTTTCEPRHVNAICKSGASMINQQYSDIGDSGGPVIDVTSGKQVGVISGEVVHTITYANGLKERDSTLIFASTYGSAGFIRAFL